MYNKCMAKRKLNSDDRRFFSLVSDAAFANPFSGKRFQIDKEIVREDAESWFEIQPKVIEQVTDRISKLDGTTKSKVNDFRDEDILIVKHAYLFEAFHKLIVGFDDLIGRQVATDNSLVVPFAKDGIANLEQRGFDKEEAKRFFAMFYQIRRAFYFIEKGLIGKCASMEKLRTNLWNNIFTHDIFHYEKYFWDKMEDFSTLLLGPTGSGKGTAAAAIGRSAYIPFDDKKNCFVESFTRTFVTINLSQFAESLLESELFGHTKGAFTGAVTEYEGILATCSRYGAVFLDEIGEISLPVQIKLLQVLQERIFSPVGSHKSKPFNGRVIAATNQSITDLRAEGRFRDDFYYRLCSDCIEVPSLQTRIRENPNELNELIAKTVERITANKSGELIAAVSEVIDKKLGKNYPWPGNVRELEQCVRRVIIKQDYEGEKVISTKDQADIFTENVRKGELDAKELISGYCKLLHEQLGTYEQVGRKTGLDRRTVKKHIEG